MNVRGWFRRVAGRRVLRNARRVGRVVVTKTDGSAIDRRTEGDVGIALLWLVREYKAGRLEEPSDAGRNDQNDPAAGSVYDRGAS